MELHIAKAAARALALSSLLILTVLPVRSQDRPEGDRVFTGETHVLAVEVPVQVLLDGEPVRGLQAEDFRVYEGRELRPLTGFEVVDLSVSTTGAAGAAHAAPAALSVPPAGRRHFLLFFDLAFTDGEDLPRAIDGARGLVRTGLHPSDLVAVAFYDSRRGVSLALQFTPDHAQVERVLDAFEVLLGRKERPVAGAEASREADPLGLTVGGFDAALVEVGQASGYQTSDFAEALAATGGVTSGPGGRYADNILYHSSVFMEQAYQEQRSAQAAYLADNLKALAQALRGIEGSKHLVLFSQGFDGSLLGTEPGDSWVGSGGGSWLLTAVSEMIEELRRAGWVIHGANVSGAEGMLYTFSDSLFFLANETGGVLVENTNDLAVGLEDVLERTSVTYVLTFQTGDVPEDGAFHAIRVELAGGPRGAELVHRAGYHAPRPPGERPPFERRVEAAARLLAGDEVGGLPAAVRATVLSYDGGVARVPVLVEVEGRVPGGATELYLYAFDEAGAVADFLARTVTLDAPTPAEGGTGGAVRGIKLAGELDLPPGRYTIRALVRGAGAGQEAVRSVAVEVPAPGGEPGLLPPLFVQGDAERWTVAALENGGAGESYPFLVEGKRIVPAAVPVLAAGEAARLLLPGLGLSGEGVRLETRILTEAGEPVASGSLRILGRRAPSPGQPDLLVAELDPQALDPGAYRLEIALAGTAQRVTAPFRVDD